MMVIRTLFILLFLITSAANVFAAELSVSESNGLSRIIIEGQNPLTYNFQKESNLNFSLTLTGETLKAPSRRNTSHIKNVTHTNNRIDITLNKDAPIRHFKIGNKVIVNIGTKTAEPKQIKVKGSDTSKSQARKPERPKVEKQGIGIAISAPPVKPEQPEQPEQPEKKQKTGLTQVPVVDVQMVPPVQNQIPIEPHVVTVSATEAIKVAAYIKDQSLYILVDRPDFAIPPVLSGPQKSKFQSFKDIPQKDKDHSLFELALPKGYESTDIRAEGGNFTWRIIFSAGDDAALNIRPFLKTNTDGREALIWRSQADAPTIIEFEDPKTGEILQSALVSFAQNAYPKMEILPYLSIYKSPIGLTFLPKLDDISTIVNPNGSIRILSSSADLDVPAQQISTLPSKNMLQRQKEDTLDTLKNPSSAFAFKQWKIDKGTITQVENEKFLDIAQQNLIGRVGGLYELVKIELANGYGPEALGLLGTILIIDPNQSESQAFKALKGVAHFLSGQFDSAYNMFFDPAIDNLEGAALWRVATLASLEDWQQANQLLPDGLGRTVLTYPDPIFYDIGISIIETLLRNGRTEDANYILNTVDEETREMAPHHMAAIIYFKGEAARQNGDDETAIKNWLKLKKGLDPFYKTRATLALTSLRRKNDSISPNKAIDSLEQLRYAWRGDDLESQIYDRLGQFYAEAGRPVKGLTLLRKGVGLSKRSFTSQALTDRMKIIYLEMMSVEGLKKLDPFEALATYESFPELLPPGDEGNQIIKNLTERMQDVNVLTKAAEIFGDAVENRFSGIEKIKAALKLASINLLDNRPEDALDILENVESILNDPSVDRPVEQEFALDTYRLKERILTARSYSQMNRPDDAFVILDQIPENEEVLTLRADIAWRAEKWEEAANALEKLVVYKKISPLNPLTAENTSLLLNWAIALNLSDSQYTLQSMKDRYEKVLQDTNRKEEFSILTRDAQQNIIADKDLINMLVGEIDLFKNFLEKNRTENVFEEQPAD